MTRIVQCVTGAALLLALILLSCNAPAPDLNNPHDPLSDAFRPHPPQFFTARLLTDHTVALSWFNSDLHTTGFTVQRRLSGNISGFHSLANLPIDSLSYLDTTAVVADTVYQYRVLSLSAHQAGISETTMVRTRVLSKAVYDASND